MMPEINKEIEWDWAAQCIGSYRMAVDRDGEIALFGQLTRTRKKTKGKDDE